MPKLSVYVPDELWEQAKGAAKSGKGKPNNSQLVQGALERMVNEQRARQTSFATGATRDEARLARVVATLRDEATAEYSRGYAAGLELAEALGFEGLKLVTNVGGLKKDEGGLDYLSTASPEEPVGKWWDEHGAAYWPHDEDWVSGSEPFRDGAEQALIDVWEALRANSWGAASAPSAEDSGEASEVDA